MEVKELSVGEIISFTGNTHYVNAYAQSGPQCKPGTVKITLIAKGATHPYHVIAVAGGGSTAYGWVNAADLAI